VSAAKYGFWSLVPSVTASATIVGTYAILRQGGASEATSGNFSISLLFLTAGIVPLNMVAPILFNDWAGERWREGAHQSYVLLSHLGLMVSVAGIVFALVFVGPLTKIVFGNRFFESAVSTQVLLFGLFPFYQNRLLTPISLAIGYPSAVAISSLIRMVAVFGFLYFSSSVSLASTAFAWVIGELICMIYMSGVVVKKTGWPITHVVGISPSWVFMKFMSMK
jgi:O-antigen/teichoic acid export membrane protein